MIQSNRLRSNALVLFLLSAWLQPALALESCQKGFIVVGLGDVIGKYQGPALGDLKKEYEGKTDVRVTYLNDGSFARSNPALAAKQDKIAEAVKAWGARIIDTSLPDKEEQLARLAEEKPEVAVVATPDFTHYDVARDLFARFPSLKRINVEKPLDADPEKARRLADPADPISQKIRAMDHYLARMPHTNAEMKQIMNHLGGGIKDFTFYFLEDGSGSDPNHQGGISRDGAIENAQREKALDKGVMLDLMPHVVAVMGYFGKIESVQVEELRAGQYTGVDGDLNKRTSIKGETFAKVKFSFQDFDGNLVHATAYVGKGIRGSRALGAEYDHNTKVLDVVGRNGNPARFDFRSKGNGAAQAHLFSPSGTESQSIALEANPYKTFYKGEIDDAPTGSLYAAEGAKISSELNDELVARISKQAEIAAYPGGVKGVRSAPYAEDLDHLPVIFRRGDSSEPSPAPAGR